MVLGDSCIALHLAASIDPAVNARCIAVASALESLALRGVRDVVPTYNAVTVHCQSAGGRRGGSQGRARAACGEDTVRVAGSISRNRNSRDLWRIVGPGPGGGRRLRRMLRGRGGAASHGDSLSRVHARVSPWLCVSGIGRSAHRDAAARDASDTSRRGVGRYRRGADRNLSVRYTRWLACDRTDIDQGVRCCESRAVSAEGW